MAWRPVCPCTEQRATSGLMEIVRQPTCGRRLGQRTGMRPAWQANKRERTFSVAAWRGSTEIRDSAAVRSLRWWAPNGERPASGRAALANEGVCGSGAQPLGDEARRRPTSAHRLGPVHRTRDGRARVGTRADVLSGGVARRHWVRDSAVLWQSRSWTPNGERPANGRAALANERACGAAIGADTRLQKPARDTAPQNLTFDISGRRRLAGGCPLDGMVRCRA